jgi:dTDP-glucose pyrophosphorylase
MNESRQTLSLVMPMAGRGSRFAGAGNVVPKPLVDLVGRPFFWWAAESVRRAAPVGEMVFVVLEDHCRAHRIDLRIRAHYPQARVLAIAEVTAGAAETARIGVDALTGDAPVAINDCDHAFLCPELATVPQNLAADDLGLLCFASNNPAYSYAVLGADGEPRGTVEKVVASPYAIAGCYLFGGKALFRQLHDAYREDCPYTEMFVSGLFNRGAGRIARLTTTRHWPFGTPEELHRIDARDLAEAFAA